MKKYVVRLMRIVRQLEQQQTTPTTLTTTATTIKTTATANSRKEAMSKALCLLPLILQIEFEENNMQGMGTPI